MTDGKNASQPSKKKTTRRRSPRKNAGQSQAVEIKQSIELPEGSAEMLINYVPGEECRVAIVQEGKLEELHVERFANASRVGNIYVGKVMNVEPAIQAAFVDFGVGDNGFLHVSDLHPRYFPGEDQETTERVGIKTPRRERPPIQAALRRGDEVIVQVLKEGVGTKGPTLTSYLSVPGRFLVMMPYMDKVGVSRKVEDEDERRKMREILDQLDLPDGFGFILRTAGMDRGKMELKRDLAYLQRLWKDMRNRLEAGGKPRLLYSESDLLVRALRDMLGSEVARVVVDDAHAVQRAARVLRIVSPRATTKLAHFADKAPMFHAFGIEQQISLMHAREVPLPSGGRLVIDQTEALVAIDVNSGKSRESRDSETNAFQTNLEAADEICRQLRLRDMGGIVVNDLIDMRDPKHRREVQKRFEDRLKRDRAKSTVLPISEFGILEMTRQRMRPSHESVHFSDCPTCRGRGVLQKPDSVTTDALRELGTILEHEKVHKVEMVVAPRIAGDLLSTKRRALLRVEHTHGKHVEVRVSEQVPIDRVSFYAYDDQGADIDLTQAAKPRPPKNLVEFVQTPAPDDAEASRAGDADGGDSWVADPAQEALESHRRAEEEEITRGEPSVDPIALDLPEADADDWGVPVNQQTARQAARQQRQQQPRQQEQPRHPQGRSPAQPGSRGDDRRDGRGDGRGGRDRDRRDDRGRGGRGGFGGESRQRGERRPQHQHFDDTDEWGEPISHPAASPAHENAQPQPRGNAQGWEDRRQDDPQDAAASDTGQLADPGEQADQQQIAPQELGPDGLPRRKRRRRRGGRGRRRGGPEGGPATPGGANAEPASPHADERQQPRYEQRPRVGDEGEWGDEGTTLNTQSHPRESTHDLRADDHVEDRDPEAAENTPIDNNAQHREGNGSGDADDQGDRPRRRRRRRGRRGRGGGSAQAGAGESARDGAGGDDRPPQREPRREDPPDARPRPTMVDAMSRAPRPPRESAPPPAAREVKPPAPAVPKAAAPTPPPGVRPPPRALYGAGRRKVSPGELNKRPQAE
jgi:ribonuclease E